MISSEDILIQATVIRKELNAVNADILVHFPLEDYQHSCLAHSTYWRRSLYSKALKQTFKTITNQYGPTAIAHYQKLALCTFMAATTQNLMNQALPGSIQAGVDEWFRQILNDCRKRSIAYYTESMSPSLITDLKVTLLRSLPVGGPWIVDLERLSLAAFRKGSWSQKRAFLKCLLSQTRGVVPYLVIHTSSRRLSDFNEAQMRDAYLRMTDLLLQKPMIKGICRRSWFLDPALDVVSPQLSYLRNIPVQNGAQLFRVPTRQADIDNAFRFSAHRRHLQAVGQYTPQGYTYIWPRRHVLAWAQQQARRPSQY